LKKYLVVSQSSQEFLSGRRNATQENAASSMPASFQFPFAMPFLSPEQTFLPGTEAPAAEVWFARYQKIFLQGAQG
jgi:hypothetical protein